MRQHLVPLRLTIAVASAMAGTIHTVAALDHLHAPVLLVGGFLAAAAAQLAVAGAALIVSDPRRLVGVALTVHLPCIAAWTPRPPLRPQPGGPRSLVIQHLTHPSGGCLRTTCDRGENPADTTT